MPRSKKGASTSRGSKNGRGGKSYRGGKIGQTTPRGRGPMIAGTSYIPFMNESVGFTLADEARQTSQHDHSSWSASSNLRQRPVTFVSAGTSEPLKLLDLLLGENERGQAEDPTRPTSPDDQHSGPVTPKESRPIEDDNGSDEEHELIGPEELDKAIQNQDAHTDEPTFFFDLKGDKALEKQVEDPIYIPSRPSSRSSSSSDEVILFKGRDAQRKIQPATQINMVQMRTEIHVMEEQIIASESVIPTQDREVKRKKPQQRKRMQSAAKDDEDAILADYIANMRENGDADDVLNCLVGNHRDLGGDDHFIPDDTSSDEGSEEANDVNIAEDGTGDDGLVDDGSPSTEEEANDGSESEIDDEALARLIAKHELDGDEDVELGELSSDSSSSDDEEHAQKRTHTNDEFDLMDWNRPSLRRKKGKGARAQINFNLSDSETEQKLQVAWKNDRLKKSERKKQREQLRALGMLGQKAKPDDLRVKYPDGMNMEQVADEFRTFLLGSDEVLTLPPMDNHARKMIHELANKFKIKSKSTGKADQRRPTLYRTLRTLPYVDSTFDQAVNRINRRYFPRLDIKGKRSQRAPQIRVNHTAATYRDGEVIGAAAPELGTGNRGRAMLEKMGWSSGTALGAMNNKGILQPVTQTMKRSKAGLG